MLRRTTDRKTPAAYLACQRGKKVWSSDEDEKLKKLVEMYGTTNWTAVSEALPERSGKQCRERFHNHLDHGIKKGDWTEDEDRIILILQKEIGNQWAKIAKMLPGRTDNAIKNRFHATERARIRGRFDDNLIEDPQYRESLVREALRRNGDIPRNITECYHDDEMDMDSEDEEEDLPVLSSASMSNILPIAHASSMDLTMILSPMTISSQTTDSVHAIPVPPIQAELEDTSVAELMELDIISLDEDDFDFDFMASNDPPSPPNNPSLNCFGYTADWNCASTTVANAASKVGNYCGLESWGMARPQPMQHQQQQIMYPQQPSMPMYHQQQQQHQQYPMMDQNGYPVYAAHPQQQQMQYGMPQPQYQHQQPPQQQQAPPQQHHSAFYNATSYFYSR